MLQIIINFHIQLKGVRYVHQTINLVLGDVAGKVLLANKHQD